MVATAATVGRGALTVRSPRSHGVVWDRHVPAEWVDRLNTVVLPGDGPSWLILRWEPGEAWWPVERWALWQVRSRAVTAELYPEALADLDGPNPRATGHACVPGWCGCKRHRNRWVPKDGHGPAVIDYWQWRLYHETGGADGGLYGTRWWCVQGEDGGHRWSLSKPEQQIRALRGESPDVPWAGALPYAPFDERVVNAIMAEDRVRRGLVLAQDYKQARAQVARQQAAMDAAKAAAARGYVVRQEERIMASGHEFLKTLDHVVGEEPRQITTQDERVAAGAAFERAGESLVASIADD